MLKKFYLITLLIYSITIQSQHDYPRKGSLLLESFESGTGSGLGIFFRKGFHATNKYNISILAHTHNTGNTDGLSINGYDGVSFCTGSNSRNERMRITLNGDVGIGTTSPDAKLTVKGTIHTQEVKVDLLNWSDFVFEEKYDLPTLSQVKNYIQQNGHLKDIPSTKEVVENGIHLGEMNSKLLQKIEELTLYTLEQEDRIEKLEQKLNLLLKK